MSTTTEAWHQVDPARRPHALAVMHAMAELFTHDGPALLCVEQDAELL
jgi:hypothetical protein